jgi:hypothetical protein
MVLKMMKYNEKQGEQKPPPTKVYDIQRRIKNLCRELFLNITPYTRYFHNLFF